MQPRSEPTLNGGDPRFISCILMHEIDTPEHPELVLEILEPKNPRIAERYLGGDRE